MKKERIGLVLMIVGLFTGFVMLSPQTSVTSAGVVSNVSDTGNVAMILVMIVIMITVGVIGWSAASTSVPVGMWQRENELEKIDTQIRRLDQRIQSSKDQL